MTRVLITGMSGAGKSSAVEGLARRGFRAIDTDTDGWCEWAVAPVGPQGGATEPDWIWREDRVAALLAAPHSAGLFVAGCKSNQGRFLDRFEHVVLLSAPLDVLLARVATRTTNPYGRSEEDRSRIAEHVRWVEPLLRRRATLELDTSLLGPGEVVDRLGALVAPRPRR